MKLKIFNFLYFSILLLVAIFLSYNNFLNADEGVVINNAWHMINGYSLYHDLFEMVAPASFYFIYLFFLIFGASYQIAILSSILFLVFGAYGVYLILKLLNKTNLYNYIIPLFLVISFSQAPIINHNTYFSLVIIWSIYFFLLFLKKKNLYFLTISAFIAGLSITFLQHKGFIFLLFTIIFLFFYSYRKKIFQNFKYIFLYLFFSFIPILIVLLFWPINLLWDQLIIFPLFNYWEVNNVNLSLFFFYFLVLIIFFLFLKPKNIYIKYLLTIQTSLLLSTYTLADYHHLILVTFPLIIIISYYIIRYKDIKIFKLILFLLLFLSIMHLRPHMHEHNFKESEWFNIVDEKCQSDYIYIGPFYPGLYLELSKKNPTKFNYLKENQSIDKHFVLAKERLKKSEADCAILIYYSNIRNKFNHTGNNLLEEYIKLNYSIIYSDDKIFIFYKNN